VSGRILVANPAYVAVADQAAAALGPDVMVYLSNLIAPGDGFFIEHEGLYADLVDGVVRKLGADRA
jgi:hypothetical protein